MSRMITLGTEAGGARRKIEIDLDVLLRTRLLVQANSGGGKSWLLRRLAEQLFGKVQVFLIDREGEFASLREKEKFGYVLVGHEGDTPADIRTARILAERLLEHNASAVFDLYEAFRSRPGDRRAWVRGFLEAVLDAPKKYWRPLVVIVDEAHQFCPQETPKAASMIEREIICGCKDAMISLATVGRKRGFCAVWATQRLAKLDKDASAELFNRLVGMTIEDVDVDRAADLMSVSRDERADFKKSLKTLDPGHFYAFGRAISTERRLVRIGPVQTTHPEPGSAKHAAGPPPPPEKVKAFLPKLADLPKEVETRAKTETELRTEIRTLKTEISVLKRAPAPAAPTKPTPAAPPPKPKIEKVDVPVVKDVDVKRVEAALGRAEQLFEKLKVVGDPVKEAAKFLNGAIGQLLSVDSGLILEAKTRKFEQAMGRRAPVAVPPPRPLPAQKAAIAKLAPKPAVAPESNGEGEELPRTHAAVLKAILELESLGVSPVSREHLAGWLGVTVSGSFRNYLGNLRSRAYVDYKENNDILITDEGRHQAPTPEVFDTSEAVLRHCLEVLPSTHGAVLKVVHAMHPDPISREEIAAELGVTMSGSFRNYLGAVHTDGMVEYGTGERKNLVRCPDWMFLLQIA